MTVGKFYEIQNDSSLDNHTNNPLTCTVIDAHFMDSRLLATMVTSPIDMFPLFQFTNNANIYYYFILYINPQFK